MNINRPSFSDFENYEKIPSDFSFFGIPFLEVFFFSSSFFLQFKHLQDGKQMGILKLLLVLYPIFI